VNASVIATQVASSARLLLLPAAATAILVAYSRIYVGVHYPLDVLAGCVLGIVVARTLSWVVATIWRFLPLSRQAF
jgi:undecaprenyl-diphosphatase